MNRDQQLLQVSPASEITAGYGLKAREGIADLEFGHHLGIGMTGLALLLLSPLGPGPRLQPGPHGWSLETDHS